MSAYDVVFRWGMMGPVPVLHVRVSGSLLTDSMAIPTIIDRAHTYVDQSPYSQVHLAYDITRTEQRLPLSALMRSTVHSKRVQRIAVIGAGARTDEMAALITSTAKRLPYHVRFFKTLDEAASFIQEYEAAPALHAESTR